MRHLLGSFFGALFLTLILGFSPAAEAAEVSSTLKVSGWVCGGCTARTEKELGELKGVKEVKADLDARQVNITYDDDEVSLEAIKEAIAKLRYKVED